MVAIVSGTTFSVKALLLSGPKRVSAPGIFKLFITHYGITTFRPRLFS
jgi:hypothetical protein